MTTLEKAQMKEVARQWEGCGKAIEEWFYTQLEAEVGETPERWKKDHYICHINIVEGSVVIKAMRFDDNNDYKEFWYELEDIFGE